MGLGLASWLELLANEYLDAYIKDGGAAVKFALVGDGGAAEKVTVEVKKLAADRGYHVALVDAASTKMHMTHDLFFAVARQIPWNSLVRDFLTTTYQQMGYQLEQGDLQIEAVASANGIEHALLRAELRKTLQSKLIWRRDALAKDFRWAMFGFCAGQAGLIPDTDISAIEDWLTGDLRRISGLKHFQIFRKIARHNANAMLASLGTWCRMAGSAGLVVVVDIRQLAVAKRAETSAESLYYTPASLMQCYEVLRQLIDDTDQLTGTLCLVITDAGFLDIDSKRGVTRYRALLERVWPDVRIRGAQNPLSALVSIDPTGDGV